MTSIGDPDDRAARSRRVEQLVTELDDANTNDAEEAQFELMEDFGAEALEPLLRAAPRFGDFGRLCAIEVFEAIGDRRAAPVLIPWLRSDNHVVRDWAAGALGRLGAADAVPDLLEAWAATKRRGTPPDWSEPVAIRHALVALGARMVIVPSAALELEIPEPPWEHAWPAESMEKVFRLLAAADQVILYFQYWQRQQKLDPRSWYGITEAGASIDLNYALPWERLVAAALGQAMDALEKQQVPAHTVGTIEWIDQTDL
jgi:HEAT repeats